jgi:hypothetical protein
MESSHIPLNKWMIQVQLLRRRFALGGEPCFQSLQLDRHRAGSADDTALGFTDSVVTAQVGNVQRDQITQASPMDAHQRFIAGLMHIASGSDRCRYRTALGGKHSGVGCLKPICPAVLVANHLINERAHSLPFWTSTGEMIRSMMVRRYSARPRCFPPLSRRARRALKASRQPVDCQSGLLTIARRGCAQRHVG